MTTPAYTTKPVETTTPVETTNPYVRISNPFITASQTTTPAETTNPYVRISNPFITASQTTTPVETTKPPYQEALNNVTNAIQTAVDTIGTNSFVTNQPSTGAWLYVDAIDNWGYRNLTNWFGSNRTNTQMSAQTPVVGAANSIITAIRNAVGAKNNAMNSLNTLNNYIINGNINNTTLTQYINDCNVKAKLIDDALLYLNDSISYYSSSPHNYMDYTGGPPIRRNFRLVYLPI